MGIVFRQSIKTTIVIFTGAVLGALINYFYAQILAKQTFGFTRNLINQGAVLQLFVILGTSGTILTYIQRFPVGHKRKVLLTFGALAPLVTTLLLLIPYFVFRDRIIKVYQPEDQPYISRYYLWIPVLVLLWSYMNQLEVYLTTQHKVALATFNREVLLRVFNLVLLALYYFRILDFDVFVVGTILIYSVPVLVMVLVSLRTESFGFSTQWRVFSRSEYKELVHFSWYHLLMGISVVAMGFLDSLMLGIYSKNGLKSLPVYTISLFLVAVMTTPYRAMAAAAIPTLNEAYISGDQERLRELFYRSGINILIVSVIMAVLIGCNLHNVVIILKKGYEAIVPLVLIMMAGRMVDMMSGLNTEMINISKYYKFNFRISIVLVVLLVGFCRLLIPEYDVYGAAWGTSLALILFNVGKVLFLRKKMGLLPFTSKSGRVILAGAITAAAGYAMPALTDFTGNALPVVAGAALDTIVRSGLILAIYTGLLIWLKPSPDLQTYLRSLRESKRLF